MCGVQCQLQKVWGVWPFKIHYKEDPCGTFFPPQLETSPMCSLSFFSRGEHFRISEPEGGGGIIIGRPRTHARSRSPAVPLPRTTTSVQVQVHEEYSHAAPE
jgi:hypothetical protein